MTVRIQGASPSASPAPGTWNVPVNGGAVQDQAEGFQETPWVGGASGTSEFSDQGEPSPHSAGRFRGLVLSPSRAPFVGSGVGKAPHSALVRSRRVKDGAHSRRLWHRLVLPG